MLFALFKVIKQRKKSYPYSYLIDLAGSMCDTR